MGETSINGWLMGAFKVEEKAYDISLKIQRSFLEFSTSN